MIVLVKNRLTQPLQFLFVLGLLFDAKKFFDDHVCDSPITVIQQMDAVHGQWLHGSCIEFFRSCKQVNEWNPL